MVQSNLKSKFSCPDSSSRYKPHQARNRCWGFVGSTQVPKLSCSGFHLVSMWRYQVSWHAQSLILFLHWLTVSTARILATTATCRKITDKLTCIEEESTHPKSSFPSSSRLLRITVQLKRQESHEYVNTGNTADKSRKKKKRIHHPDYTNLRQSTHTIPTGTRPPYHHPTIVGLFTKEQKTKWWKENWLRSPVHGSVLPCQALPVTLFLVSPQLSTRAQSRNLLFFLSSSGLSGRLKDALPLLSSLPPLLLLLLLSLLLMLMIMPGKTL